MEEIHKDGIVALFVPWPVTRTVPDAFIACYPSAETVRKKKEKKKKKRRGDWHKFAPRLTFASNYSKSPREGGREIDSQKELEGNVREIRVVEA